MFNFINKFRFENQQLKLAFNQYKVRSSTVFGQFGQTITIILCFFSLLMTIVYEQMNNMRLFSSILLGFSFSTLLLRKHENLHLISNYAINICTIVLITFSIKSESTSMSNVSIYFIGNTLSYFEIYFILSLKNFSQRIALLAGFEAIKVIFIGFEADDIKILSVCIVFQIISSTSETFFGFMISKEIYLNNHYIPFLLSIKDLFDSIKNIGFIIGSGRMNETIFQNSYFTDQSVKEFLSNCFIHEREKLKKPSSKSPIDDKFQNTNFLDLLIEQMESGNQNSSEYDVIYSKNLSTKPKKILINTKIFKWRDKITSAIILRNFQNLDEEVKIPNEKVKLQRYLSIELSYYIQRLKEQYTKFVIWNSSKLNDIDPLKSFLEYIPDTLSKFLESQNENLPNDIPFNKISFSFNKMLKELFYLMQPLLDNHYSNFKILKNINIPFEIFTSRKYLMMVIAMLLEEILKISDTKYISLIVNIDTNRYKLLFDLTDSLYIFNQPKSQEMRMIRAKYNLENRIKFLKQTDSMLKNDFNFENDTFQYINKLLRHMNKQEDKNSCIEFYKQDESINLKFECDFLNSHSDFEYKNANVDTEANAENNLNQKIKNFDTFAFREGNVEVLSIKEVNKSEDITNLDISENEDSFVITETTKELLREKKLAIISDDAYNSSLIKKYFLRLGNTVNRYPFNLESIKQIGQLPHEIQPNVVLLDMAKPLNESEYHQTIQIIVSEIKKAKCYFQLIGIYSSIYYSKDLLKKWGFEYLLTKPLIEGELENIMISFKN